MDPLNLQFSILIGAAVLLACSGYIWLTMPHRPPQKGSAKETRRYRLRMLAFVGTYGLAICLVMGSIMNPLIWTVGILCFATSMVLTAVTLSKHT